MALEDSSSSEEEEEDDDFETVLGMIFNDDVRRPRRGSQCGCIHINLDRGEVAPPPFSFSFDFTNTSSYRQDDLKFEGNATVHGNLVDLTCNSFGKDSKDCVGRVSYAHRVPFYDNLTGEVASFQTRFTFVIMLDNNTMNYKGDGMAFFLAYYPSTMPATSGGGNLGLMSQVDGKRTTFGKDQFIAVEFDTYNNSYDPSTTFDHIGIDINSVMDSVNTTRLPNFSLNGSMTATVTFDNTSRMLIADLRFDDNDNYRPVQVSTQLPHPVTTLLPDQVAVGFSAATGSGMELHQLLSWSFNSTLAPPRKDHDKKAAVVGWLIGGAMALLVLWYQIVKDIGSALVYLHHECEPYILHRDIKPGNILLDNKFNAKLADFGLSRIGNQDNMTLMTTAIGTEGYIDPECRKDGKVKFYPKSDVYSFGIVLLDIVCTGKSRERVWELYIRGKVMEATDGRLHGGDDLDRRQMKSVAVLGLWCSLPDGAKRPTVRKAMEVLERDESLPDLNYRVNTSVPSASGHQHIDTSSSDQQAFMSDES
ncbi:unnamed protein product [Triticum aestivum]|uniref:non-specific serine/threonine protein kinase n=2 Tax=Triticum TaxID=4564 RepID=A0A9R1PBX8_TRITD|nr:unnamed protein product [Triticum aestivum]VAH40040.1 unnamed protein product [Triticum turgidum subsp. durum]